MTKYWKTKFIIIDRMNGKHKIMMDTAFQNMKNRLKHFRSLFYSLKDCFTRVVNYSKCPF